MKELKYFDLTMQGQSLNWTATTKVELHGDAGDRTGPHTCEACCSTTELHPLKTCCWVSSCAFKRSMRLHNLGVSFYFQPDSNHH